MNQYDARKFILMTVQEIADLAKTVEFMEDADVEKALDKVISLIGNPVMSQEKAAVLVVYFQALSVHFKARGNTYSYLLTATPKSIEHKRKGWYISMSEKMDDMCNALKILAKA